MAHDGRHELDAADLDRGDTETLELLLALDRTPGADPVFAVRLLADLDDEIAARRRVQLHTSIVLPPLAAFRDATAPRENGHRAAAMPDLTPVRIPARRPLGYHVVTAVLVVLVVLGTVASLGGLRVGRGFDVRFMPAVDRPWPMSEQPDPSDAHGLLTQMTAPALPLEFGWIGIYRWTFSPHTDPITTLPYSGPTMILVLSGELTVTLDQPGQIAHGLGRQRTEPFPAVYPGSVVPGDTLLLPTGVGLTVGNDADAPATAIFVSVLNDAVRDLETSFAASKRTSIEDLVTDYEQQFAPGPGRLELSRATLQPGEMLPPPTAGTYQLVAAESTYLGYLRRSPDGSVTNLEKTPLTVLILTITQDYPTLTTATP